MRKVIIFGSDGLRHDLLDLEVMPNYRRVLAAGTHFTRFHAAYPPQTRVSMTTLTTGVYPAKHGVAANSMYLPEFDPENKFQTGDHRHLMPYPSRTGQDLVLRPTLGDRDECLGELLDEIKARGMEEVTDVLLLSDQGHSTMDPAGNLIKLLEGAREATGVSIPWIVLENHLHVRVGQEPTRDEVAKVVAWLYDQEWCNLVLGGRPELEGIPGLYMMEDLQGALAHDRSPILAVCPRWSDARNAFGKPGKLRTLKSAGKKKWREPDTCWEPNSFHSE